VGYSRPSETTFYNSGIRDTLLMRPPKKRPRSAVIADMSVNFLERQVLRRGHRLLRIPVNNRLTPTAIDRFRSALLASIPKNTNDE